MAEVQGNIKQVYIVLVEIRYTQGKIKACLTNIIRKLLESISIHRS